MAGSSRTSASTPATGPAQADAGAVGVPRGCEILTGAAVVRHAAIATQLLDDVGPSDGMVGSRRDQADATAVIYGSLRRDMPFWQILGNTHSFTSTSSSTSGYAWRGMVLELTPLRHRYSLVDYERGARETPTLS